MRVDGGRTSRWKTSASRPAGAASRPRWRATPGGRRWPDNFERAAELVDVPQDFIMQVYELLRPGRAKASRNCWMRPRHSSSARLTGQRAWRHSSRRPQETYEQRGLYTYRF